MSTSSKQNEEPSQASQQSEEQSQYSQESGTVSKNNEIEISDSDDEDELRHKSPATVGELTLLPTDSNIAGSLNDSLVWVMFHKFCSCKRVTSSKGSVLIHVWDSHKGCPPKSSESVSSICLLVLHSFSSQHSVHVILALS